MDKPLAVVFGGSGFVGRNTVRALAKAGYRVRAATRRPNLAQYLPPMGSVGQIQLFKCDVSDENQVAAALAKADVVVNLIGILYRSGGQGFEAVHVEAAERIARAAKAAGARVLVHVSALGADENSTSRYTQSKARGEAHVRAAFPEATVLRPSIVFGPEDSFFNRFAGMARLLPALPLIGGGKTKFQPVFVGDVAAAIVKCAGDPATHGKTYELAGPNTYSFKELMQFLLAQIGRRRLLVPVPFPLAIIQGAILGILPKPLLTTDQVRSLRTDNIVSSGALSLADLGIVPDSIEAITPSYLWRFRAKGQYEGFNALEDSQ
ncbi:MAG TPA: complex I NDUFA9 subunit family protein [Rhizomicrobium sp.]|jgi:NADH dehydrogenase